MMKCKVVEIHKIVKCPETEDITHLEYCQESCKNYWGLREGEKTINCNYSEEE